jgi:hypothetical protein
VGQVPDPFTVQDVTGPEKGTSLCYRCKFGGRPTVSIFTRSIDAHLATLVKELDQQVAKNEKQQMRAFVVLLSQDPKGDQAKLTQLAKKQNIKNVPLTIFEGPIGPREYRISKKADVTVMMWVNDDVKVCHGFSKGKLDKKSVQSVASETKHILN